MNKALKWILIIVGILAVIGIGLSIAWKNLQKETKKHSPEETVVYNEGGKALEVFYNRPSKKDRDIFGGLVPYGEVWRTGANEATTFTTGTDISVNGESLPEGKYTLWTIPGENSWQIIFNNKSYAWGVSWGGKASRDPNADVLKVEVPAESLEQVVEMFTISFETNELLNMVLQWDQTKVSVPIE